MTTGVLSLTLALSEEIQKSKSMQDTTKLSNVEQKDTQQSRCIIKHWIRFRNNINWLGFVSKIVKCSFVSNSSNSSRIFNFRSLFLKWRTLCVPLVCSEKHIPLRAFLDFIFGFRTQ